MFIEHSLEGLVIKQVSVVLALFHPVLTSP